MASSGSNYLEGVEGLYGLPTPLPAGVAEQASAIVDSEIKRPEGLIYVNDKNGNPAYMKALMPVFTYQISAGVAPGALVTVTVTPPNVRPDMLGEVLVLDRGNPDLVEAVVVVGTAGNNQITLAAVQNTHAANVKMDMGLVITEERSVPAKRSIVRYSRFPCPMILSLMGRYAYGRRSDQSMGGVDANLLASVQQFGGAPVWTPITISNASWSDATGEIWIPSGNLLAYYSDVKIKYVAGFPIAPDPVVRGTAAIAQSLIATTSMGGGIKAIQAGDTRITRFGATNVDENTRSLLEPYKARLFY